MHVLYLYICAHIYILFTPKYMNMYCTRIHVYVHTYTYHLLPNTCTCIVLVCTVYVHIYTYNLLLNTCTVLVYTVSVHTYTYHLLPKGRVHSGKNV
jgi:hypothetical protein